MRTPSHRVRRLLVLVLVVVVGAAAWRRTVSPAVGRPALLPAIGGDTWPPVPVKDAGAA